MPKPIAIYTGYMIRYPLGGHVLSELQNIVGLQRLGYDVIYVEESGGNWPSCYDPVRNTMTTDPTYGLGEVRRVLRPYDIDHRVCFLDASGRYHGLNAATLRELCRQSTMLFGHSRVTWLEEFRECRTRVFIDTDPAITQFELVEHPRASGSGYVSPHDFDFCFTIGERIGKPDCPIPTAGLRWLPTRWPLVPELVPVRFTPDAPRFTTVMSWSARGTMTCGGVAYGDKNAELLKLLDLPQRTGPVFELALAGGHDAKARLEQAGWVISDSHAATRNLEAYLDFIGRSRGEFSVAKNVYVATRSGWFSERTLAYLADGKPAIVQDTGWSDIIPTGEGVFAFCTADDIASAVEAIAKDYRHHCKAARKIAEEYFNSDKVFGALLRQCDLPVVS